MNKTPIISIIYHSNNGHTRKVATLLAQAVSASGASVRLLAAEEAAANFELLHESDTIVFGSPTYFGTVSAGFKTFMEATGKFWYKQPWRNKLAAGFTCSSTVNGDKLNTLSTLFHFAAQHSMQWVPLGVLPRFNCDWQTEGQNRLASYTGLMVQTDNSSTEIQPFSDGDLLTIELFGRRLYEVTSARHTISQ